MSISPYLSVESICVGLQKMEKEQMGDILAALLQKGGATSRYRTLGREITAYGTVVVVGGGVAILQIQSAVIKRAALAAITLKEGICIDPSDPLSSRLIFLAALPENIDEELASKLSVLLLDEDLRDQLTDAANEDTFLKLLQMAENGKYGGYEKKELPFVIAVLDAKNEQSVEAAAVLQQKAGALGIVLRAVFYEKGDPAVLLDVYDMQEADGILLMCGARADAFDGKPLLRAGVTDGIYRPEHLLNSVTKAPIYHKKIQRYKTDFLKKISQIFKKR